MSANKFIAIDETIVCTGDVAEFSLYYPLSIGSDMQCFIKKGEEISNKSRLVLSEQKALYISYEDKELYDEYCNLYSINLKKNEFDKKTALVYSKASTIIDELFSNPEALGASRKAKKVVNDLVNIILDDHFTIRSLMSIAAHDYYTHTHSLNVSVYALSLGAFLKFEKEELSALGESALLHDLGKSKISPEIINKNGRLTDLEYNKMKKHPELGFYLAMQMGISNKDVLHGIKFHHEKMDGSGYPSRLRGDSIPINARIIALCDIFDALTSKRSYKPALTSFDALKLIKSDMSTHIDLKLLNSMILMFRG